HTSSGRHRASTLEVSAGGSRGGAAAPAAGRKMVAVFAQEEELLQAVDALRQKHIHVVDVFAPYAVHGLDRALALKPSRLPWVCFFSGLLGAVGMIAFQFWATAVSWPIDVGGKPWNSLPAFVPITFEMMVLLAGIATVVAFIWVAELRPR